jgi:hypothetical protein
LKSDVFLASPLTVALARMVLKNGVAGWLTATGGLFF